MADWQAQYQTILFHGEAAQPTEQSPPAKGKGRRKQSATRNLLNRLSKEQDAVLAFLYNLAVPFDNNLTERDLRMIKCSRRFLAAFAISPEPPPFVAFGAISRPCVNKGWLC